MRINENVKWIGKKRLKQDQRAKGEKADAFDAFKDEFIEMLRGFESMRNGHLGQINISNHRKDINPANAKPVHCSPYQTGPTSRGFEID